MTSAACVSMMQYDLMAASIVTPEYNHVLVSSGSIIRSSLWSSAHVTNLRPLAVSRSECLQRHERQNPLIGVDGYAQIFPMSPMH